MWTKSDSRCSRRTGKEAQAEMYELKLLLRSLYTCEKCILAYQEAETGRSHVGLSVRTIFDIAFE